MKNSNYLSPRHKSAIGGLVVHIRGPVAELLDRLDAAMTLPGLPDSMRIQLVEIRTGLAVLSRRHAGPLTLLIHAGGLPDPGLRPDLNEARKDGTLSAVLGSRLIDVQSQNKTVAARAMAERKTFGHLS